MPDLSHALTETEIFSGLTQAELRWLASRSRSRLLSAGERLSTNDEFWLVSHGLVRVTDDSAEPPISWLCSGRQHLACLDLQSRKRRSLDAVALLPTELISIPHAAFERFLSERPKLLCAALHALSERLNEERELRAIMTLPSSERMLAAVLTLYRRVGPRIPLTRAALAEMTGLARETSIRSLSPYEKRGLIKTRRGVIEVLKPADLQQALDRRLGSR